MKWRGTSRPNVMQSGTESVKIMIKGHVVVEDLIANNVKLLPATIDPFIAEGPAMTCFRYGRVQRLQNFNTLLHDFGRAQGTQASIEMCRLTMMDNDMQAIVPKADSFWIQKRSDTLGLFGATHVDNTPATWSAQFLGSKYTWVFSQHILWCQQKNS
eukprot:10801218-Ditylum_brightwellii.AAC.1